ncbi:MULTISPECIES: nucleic acid/nucleotide deaminase domain-containing protein [Paenibacillus]|uniref:nucleic acid/nucleotide deaminase domain-containing protein n=1 Tax=Paenibacillus TaxID=44249 RepID=UPI002FE2179C
MSMKQSVDPDRLLQLSNDMRRLEQIVEERVTKLETELRNVASQVRAGYPEYGVQSALAEVEAVLTDTRNHAKQLHDRLHNKGHALKTAAEEYIEVERKSQDLVKKSPLKFVIGPKQLSQLFFDLVKRYSPFDLVKLALQQAKELTLQAKLSRFREDEQIKAYLEMLQHGTLEEQRLAEQQLTLIVNAFDQIARCQTEYAVYGRFGNAKYMDEVHQLAVEARAQLKELGVSEKWYATKVDLRALYSGSPLDALRYDPYRTDGSVMPTIGEQRFAIALGMTHSKYQAWARERYDRIEAGAIAAEAKRKEIALKIAEYNEGIPKPNIEYVQQHLAEKGLFQGEITGEYSPELLQAIEAFQAEFNRSGLSKELQHSFGVDGKIDYKLLNLIYLEKGLIEQTPNLFNVCYIPDMLGKMKDTRNGFEKSIDSFKEIGSDMLAASDARFQKAFDSPGDFLNYLTMGIPKGIYDGYVARGEKRNESTYDYIDWLSSGLLSGVHQTFVGAVHPEEAYSKEHWLNSIGLAAMLTSPVKMKPTKPSIPDLNKSSGAFKVNTTTELDKVEGKGIEGTGNGGSRRAQNPMFAEDWDAYFKSKYGDENVTRETSGKGKDSKDSTGNRDANSKPPIQVGYGETDLSAMAKKYRIENKAFDLRNLVVAEIEVDGVRTLKVFESTKRTEVRPSGKVKDRNVHSEMVLYEDKIFSEKNGQTYVVHRVYTEREPCILGGHNCKDLLATKFPDAEVTYSVEYGDPDSRNRGNAELAKILEKLKEE